MNNRIEIKIAVIGDKNSGKETFARMLFLDNQSKIRVEPLSRLGEMYMEIDSLYLKKNSKKTIEECKEHNDLILKQSKINGIENLRKNDIDPFFYKYANRIKGLINTNNSPHINRNILLTFYFIGDNYMEFTKELDMANIYIYLMDINSYHDEQIFDHLMNIIKQSKYKKYIIPIINKCDVLDVNGQPNDENKINYLKLVQLVATKSRDLKYTDGTPVISTALAMSCKFACMFRQIIYDIPYEITADDKNLITEIYTIKKDSMTKDIQRYSEKYLKRCGYTSFRDTFVGILATKYRTMVEDNLNYDLAKLELSPKISGNLKLIKNKTKKLTTIFKKNYEPVVIEILKKILQEITKSENPDIASINCIEEIYNDNKTIMQLILDMKSKLYDKIVRNITNKLYGKELSVDIFLPSQVHILFDRLITSYLPKDETNKLALHICELYSTKTREMIELKTYPNYLGLLFEVYFSDTESKKIMSMLNEIKVMMNFDIYKIYLIQILLTKLMVAERCAATKIGMDKQVLTKIIGYCKCLKYYLSESTNKKYEYLFINISDICTKIILTLDGSLQLDYISENLDTILNFKPDRVIDLDKFIIKMIKKSNYRAVIADDENDSGEDSDVDIYGQDNKTDFIFTKDDLVSSDTEEYDDDVSSDKKRLNDDEEVEV